MLLNPGVQVQVISETTTGAGVTERVLTLQSDSILSTLSVSSISGLLDVEVFARVGTTETSILVFSQQSAPTTELLLERADAAVTSTILVRATYTGVCSYEIQIRAITAGTSVTSLETLVAEGNASLASIDSKVTTTASGIRVDVVASTLPSGAATASLQTAGNSSLSSVDAKLSATNSTLALIDTHVDGLEALATAGNASLASIDGKLTAPLAVTGDFYQATQPVSAVSLPLPAGASTEATLALIKAKTDNIDVLLSTRTKPSDTQPVSAVSLPLPAGASTAANQTTANGLLASIDSKLTAPLAISAAALPLPAGAATAVRQDTGNTSLASIDGKLTGVATAARQDTGNTSLGSIDTKLSTTNSILTTIDGRVDGLETLGAAGNASLTSIDSKLTSVSNTMGQATGNASLASIDGKVTTTASGIRVDVVSSALPAGAATSALQTTGNASLSSIDTKLITTTTTPALDSSAVVVRPVPYEPITHSATAVGFVTAALATDIFTIIGSGTKTIRIKKVRVSGTTTSGSPIKVTIRLLKRSTANTGGTSSIVSAVPHDSTSAAGTSVARSYTANPTTLGTLVGAVRAQSTSVQAAGMPDMVKWNFHDGGQPIVLRGAAENLAVNFGGVSITGPVISVYVEWEEV